MPARRLVYQQGDHICTLYTSPAEQLAAAIEYVRGGLERGERCLYICGEHTPQQFRCALEAAGVDVSAEEERGTLVLVTKHEAHLQGGAFCPDRMIHMLDQAVLDALAAGFQGLCAAGDMAWVLDEAPGTEHLAEYESRLNEFYSKNRALGLCQYSRKMPEHILDHCLATHRLIRMDGPIALENPFYEPPQHAIGRTAAEPQHLRRKLRTIDAQRRRAHRVRHPA
jgi:chemotaxis family two-component system sensor kinase Cph1